MPRGFIVLRPLLTVLWIGLHCVNVAFPDHTHSLFVIKLYMSFLVLQSPHLGRDSCLFILNAYFLLFLFISLVWYLLLSFPDLCLILYYNAICENKKISRPFLINFTVLLLSGKPLESSVGCYRLKRRDVILHVSARLEYVQD